MQTLTTLQVRAVDEQRAAGRTDRQIEKVLGLSHGFLARPWMLDTSDEQAKAKADAARAEWARREAAFNRYRGTDRVLRGWRPNGDCVSTRPDVAPLRALSRRLPSQSGS